MGAETGIAWTDSTFNPWIGCTKVSDGCKHCYAEAQDHRWGHDRWGPGKLRTVTSPRNWLQPLAWNAAAKKSGVRHRVFCSSLADVFDLEAPDGAREWLWELIASTPMLDWQLLTKRPENIMVMIPQQWRTTEPENVWYGTTVENQEQAEKRIPELLRVPAAVRFLSCEPLLGPVVLGDHMLYTPGCHGRRIDWLIVGGESGPCARTFCIEWARSLLAECKAAEVPCFMKQMGANPSWNGIGLSPLALVEDNGLGRFRVRLEDSHGGNEAEWPLDMRVQEFPR